jgi:mutator protein MutT
VRTIKRDIAGAIIFSNDKHVLLGRNNRGGVYSDLWVIPGGGIEDGETKKEAVSREIMEEVGIDINDGIVTFLPEIQTGITEKTLRNTKEKVLVSMTFYNFKVDIDLPASQIPILLEDDFEYAEWVPIGNLSDKEYSPSVKRLLESLDLV